eukprot:TRINITY_DN2688_c0_g1_i1.p1 TRINITY_DN2688_c0_g1~~TRINITY_DN2688_c0_g1_i1.p1  ORF type:complete len:269 (+),score=38.69 TRINITY_DN2688_c0_g1_i1:104-808(+)
MHKSRVRVVGLMTLSCVCTLVALCVVALGDGGPTGKDLRSMCRGVGLQPFVDVTVPFGASLGEGIAVAYSFVPWLVALTIIGGAVVRRTSTLMAGLCYVTVMVICNEILVKRNFPQSRPMGSCLVSPGMPSSHSLLSIGLLVWFLLEYTHNSCVKSWWAVAALLILAPVPPSRIILQDHSIEQAVAGSLLGSASAMTFFAFMRQHLEPKLNNLCTHPYAKKLGIVNDYTLLISA